MHYEMPDGTKIIFKNAGDGELLIATQAAGADENGKKHKPSGLIGPAEQFLADLRALLAAPPD